MSVVVAARGSGVTIVGCDSAADAGDQRFIIADKVFQPTPWLALGFVGVSAAGSRIRFALNHVAHELSPPADGDAAQWVWENLSDLMVEHAHVPEDADCMTQVLVVVQSSILVVELDDKHATPFEDVRGYTALGAGYGPSLGYLDAIYGGAYDKDWILDAESTKAYVKGSVEAAIRYCPSVSGEVRLFEVKHG